MAHTLRLCKILYEAGGKTFLSVTRYVSAVVFAKRNVMVYYYVLVFKQGTMKTLKVEELTFHAS